MKHPVKSILIGAAIGALSLSASAFANKMDDQIEASAKDSYVFKTYLKDDSVGVDAKNGVVTLKGSVADPSHKNLAEYTVAALPGVTHVENDLKVKADLGDETSDAWITTKVKTALLFNAEVSTLGTQVDTKGGVVTLRGEADTEAQKELTGEYAKDVAGVKEVQNLIVATKEPKKSAESAGKAVGAAIDDASITAQAKMALLTHQSTSAIRTDIDTKNSIVTITGKAKNDAEKELVGKLVGDIRGVKSVNNNMTVGGAS